MTKKDKFGNKEFIMSCDMPSELFTVKGIKREYRILAKMWHPDVSSLKEALFIMSKINALYNEGQLLIEQNKFYEKERLIYRNHKKEFDRATTNSTSSSSDYNRASSSAHHNQSTTGAHSGYKSANGHSPDFDTTDELIKRSKKREV
ncbi:J domain-containing protein [Fusibacter bizertensis]